MGPISAHKKTKQSLETGLISASSAQKNHFGWEYTAATLNMFKAHAIGDSTIRGYKRNGNYTMNQRKIEEIKSIIPEVKVLLAEPHDRFEMSGTKYSECQ